MKQLTRTIFTFALLLTAAVSMAETDAELICQMDADFCAFREYRLWVHRQPVAGGHRDFIAWFIGFLEKHAKN